MGRVKRLALMGISVAVLLAPAAACAAKWHHVQLTADRHERTWVSPQRFPEGIAVDVRLYRDGHRIQGRVHRSGCSVSYRGRKVWAWVSICAKRGRRPLRIRYLAAGARPIGFTAVFR